MPDTSILKTTNIIVSAFMSNINTRIDRSLDKYIHFGHKLIQLAIPKIIFLEKHIIDTYFPTPTQKSDLLFIPALDRAFEYIIHNKHTIFILFDTSDMYFHNLPVPNFHVDSANQNKDTLAYMFLQNYKPEWLRIAILFLEEFALNALEHCAIFGKRDGFIENRSIPPVLGDSTIFPENNQYLWVDFGIRHMFSSDNELIDEFNHFNTNVSNRFLAACAIHHPMDRVRFASCWPEDTEILDIETRVQWIFAGSVFGGFRNPLLRFADLAKQECLDLITQKGHIMWEVNVWILILRKYPELFDLYHCDHNCSIIAAY